MSESEEIKTGAKEVIEIMGAAVEELINSLFERIVAPYNLEEMNVLIEEKTTVLDMIRLIVLQIQNGEANNWKPESKERWNRVLDLLASARKIAGKVGKAVIQKYFTYDNAMQVFKTRRPDLYERFKQEDGKEWLQANLIEITDFLTR